MVSLNCPLCCNETFPSHSSLKCHILNILDNLVCPSCHEKFEKLSELAQHLETDCSETYLIDSEEAQASEGATEDEGALPNRKTDDVGGSILAKALLASPLRDSGEKVEVYDEDSQYYCQMCCVHFNDIDEHLKSYHEGQEIVLEEDGNGETSVDPESTILIIDPLNQEEDDENEDEGEAEEQESNYKTTTVKKLNTITQQVFKDKDGRLYTRKFVKIDKFWLHDEDLKVPLMLDKNDLKKETVGDKGAMLEINKCPNCDLYFPVSDLFEQHKCECGTDRLKCTHCAVVFDNPEALREHVKVHASKENASKRVPVGPFNCEVCNTTFPTFKSLRLHRRMHDPIKVREIEAPARYGLTEDDVNEDQVRHMFICKICNKTYDKQYEYVHMNSHTSNNGYNCEVCNRKFFTQTNLDMHMKAHSNNKKFTCSYCKKPFVTYDALNDHLLNQCQKRPYACQFCGRRFARPHEKVKHERIHTGEKPHVCDICGKAFRVSYCLTLHLRTHSGTRPYQCKHCGKRFKSHSVYNHHLLTHSDVRAYKCPYCPKAFKTSVQLAGHKNSHIKPFTCTECNRPFASLYAVRAHMESHKRDNNLKYECWMCGALYSRAFALRDHLKQQHQQVEGDKAKAVALSVDEEMGATNSILVTEDDIILGLDGATNIEIIENETE